MSVARRANLEEVPTCFSASTAETSRVLFLDVAMNQGNEFPVKEQIGGLGTIRKPSQVPFWFEIPGLE